MPRSLIVMPDDTAQPILDAINAATKSLRIKMFIFSDPGLLQAVAAAHKRGVKTRVMLNPARRSGESENEESRKFLNDSGVEVLDSNPAFDLTHEKSMVIDDETAYIKSLNWEPRNLTETRDYAVVTSHKHEVDEVIECFDADWTRGEFKPGEHSHLIWCVGNGRQRLAQFIDEAKNTLWLQNERYQDPVVIEHLVRANRRGVKIHRLRHVKLHGKLLYADGVRAIIGSINIAPGSFDSRRELAIEVRDDHIIDRLHDVVHHDWKHSHELDLSDEGLLADLEKHGGKGLEELGLDV